MHLFQNYSYSYVSLLSVVALVVEPRTPKKGVGVGDPLCHVVSLTKTH